MLIKSNLHLNLIKLKMVSSRKSANKFLKVHNGIEMFKRLAWRAKSIG